MEHPNATKMRETVGAFMSGDLPLMLEGFAPDVVWYAPGPPSAGRPATAARLRWAGRSGGVESPRSVTRSG